MNCNKNHIKKCIELAKLGEGRVSPNPLVGAIVLDKDENVVGEGYHQKYGEAHAEVNALNQAGKKAEGGTIYVSLEPCSHYGKTPPCVDLIIKNKLKKVIIAMKDPNPKVDGISKLKQAGIEIETGILEDEAKELNEVFIKNQIEKKPFIAIKTATTLDGKIATKTGSSKWITGTEAREKVQELRNKYDAILTGSQTIITDNPSMDCRMQNGRDPIKVILDTNSKTSPDAKVYQKGKVILATNKPNNKYPKNVEILACPLDKNDKIDLNFLTKALFNKGIYSILVEAGGTINSAFLQENSVDKIYHFIAPKILGDNQAQSFVQGFDIKDINNCSQFDLKQVQKIGSDVIMTYYPASKIG